MGNKKLWCVAIRPEADSPYEQTPAVSREVAQQAVARYKLINAAMFGGGPLAEWADLNFQVQQWHGTREDHIRGMSYTQDWFNQPMFQVFSLEQVDKIFSYRDLVICYKQGSTPLTTKDINEAKRFYEAV